MSDLRALAARLAGEPVAEPEPVHGGGNNRLYRTAGPSGGYALKLYARGDDWPQRQEREFAGLRFLWAHGVRDAAEPLALDVDAGAGLFRWIDGRPAGAAGEADIAALAGFAGRLHGLRTAAGAAELRPAREAVLSRGELEAQLSTRLARLGEVAAGYPALAVLLRDIGAETGRRRLDAPAGAELPRAQQTLSPSDFGFHNALRSGAGLTFVDFEYFGWDDPVKLVADVLWHPGMALGQPLRQKFFRSAADVYEVDAHFRGRFERDAPLYGLRWALIVLNEFLPGVWERRVAAGQAADRPAALERQLAKADVLLGRVRRNEALA